MEKKKFMELMNEYINKFDDSFPSMAFSSSGYDEMSKIIQKCIDEDKDVYDLGILDINLIY